MAAVVLVEGTSDQVAIEVLAARRGRDLDAERVAVVPMGGATNIGRFLEEFGPAGLDVSLAGLCDAGEEWSFRRGLSRAGIGPARTRDDLESLGFFVCVEDLEDELIRALGTDTVLEVVAAQGDLRSFRRFQNQPAKRGQTDAPQLRRFLGTRSGRKAQYAKALVDALDLANVPRPLDALLARI